MADNPRFSSTGRRSWPSAHLQDVHVLQQRQLGGVSDLRDDGQTRVAAGLNQQLYPGGTQPLKRIGRGAGLENAAPQHLRAGGLYRPGHGGDLRRGLQGPAMKQNVPPIRASPAATTVSAGWAARPARR